MTRHSGLPEGVSDRSDLPSVKKSAYRSPRTGEPRRQRKPLKIDRLPQTVKDAIVAAREAGETWSHTSEIASAAAGLRISVSAVQRWHDLRVEQPRKEEGAIPGLLRRMIRLLEEIREEVRS